MYVLRLVRQSVVVLLPTVSLITSPQRLVPEEDYPRHAGLSAVGVPGRIYATTIDTGESSARKLYSS